MQTKKNCLNLINLLRAKTRLIYVVGNDESRTMEYVRQSILSWMIKQSGKKKVDIDNQLKYGEWSCTTGLRFGSVQQIEEKVYPNNVWQDILSDEPKKINKVFQFRANPPDDPTQVLFAALDVFEKEKLPDKKNEYIHILVIKDIHNLIKGDPILMRKIKEIVMSDDPKNVARHIVILSPAKVVPIDLENHCDILEWKLPDAEDISNFVNSLGEFEIVKEASATDKNKYTEQEFKDVINAFVGLPFCRIEEHCCQSFAEKEKRLDSKFLTVLKTKHILENSSLELVDTDVKFDQVGGMDGFKHWVHDRERAFSKEAIDFGVEPPKGVMLVGIQGCGKTLMSRAISSLWGLPLVKFDVGKVFSKTIGSSEENIRNTLATIEALSPCVVQIDEIEKGLSGVQSSNFSDGGTTSRVVGTLLTWMQDKTASAFIIATANDVSQLPPELMRKGRFDEIFFCSLPEAEEREKIFGIHLEKRGYLSHDYDLKLFASQTTHYSGAEIEQIIKSAILLAFNSKLRKLKNEHVIEAIKQTIPLYATCKQDIDWLLAWVGWDDERQEGLRARFASSPAKGNHASSDVVADTDGAGKKVIMKINPVKEK